MDQFFENVIKNAKDKVKLNIEQNRLIRQEKEKVFLNKVISLMPEARIWVKEELPKLIENEILSSQNNRMDFHLGFAHDLSEGMATYEARRVAINDIEGLFCEKYLDGMLMIYKIRWDEEAEEEKLKLRFKYVQT